MIICRMVSQMTEGDVDRHQMVLDDNGETLGHLGDPAVGKKAELDLHDKIKTMVAGLSPSTLAKMRLRGDGPVYAKSGPRIVVYDVADLDAWLAGRKRRSTSELDPAER